MKKIYLEIILSALFVLLSTVFFYGRLSGFAIFWSAQTVWSTILMAGWVIVSLGYFHQGWLVHSGKNAEHVSIVLPVAVFSVQCILFVKGIFYGDWSLIYGAVIVNSGVVFSLYQIIKARHKSRTSLIKS